MLALGSQVALVTAGHSLRRDPKSAFTVGAGGSHIPLVGTGVFTGVEGVPFPGEDVLDLEVVLLDPQSASRIDLGEAASVDDLETQPGVAEGAIYLVSGFPSSKHRVHIGNRETDGLLHSLLLFAKSPGELVAGADARQQILLHYDQKQFIRDGASVTSPSLRGFSGAPVWRILPHLRVGDRRRLKLVGTLIERHRGDLKHVVVTTTSVVLHLLAALEPSFATHFPSPVRSQELLP